ncbi:MAG: hypothetical protein ACOYOB_19885 [Myxococcota bacterium]
MNPHQVVYRRTELYVQVWAAPMLEVAKKYDVSDVALVSRWRLADDIRAFVADAQLRGDRGLQVDWSWALGYADRVDPLGPTRQNGGHDDGET